MPTVLITGANRGIGLEFARQYAAEGWQVLAACRNPAAATDLRRALELTAGRPDTALMPLDVADDASIGRLAQSIVDCPIDVVINNAGMLVQRQADLDAVDPTAWMDSFRVNSIGPFLVTRALLANLAAGKRRLVVVLSSQLGSIANTTGGRYAYRSSKAAANMVARSLAMDLADRAITVVAVHPGWVRTAMGGDAAPLPATDSVARLRQLFDRLGLEDTGRFFNYDGQPMPW